MYRKYFKRLFDFIFSLFALLVLSPVFLILIIVGIVELHGNPFFTQERPGKDEKLFKLIKFRTMSNAKDSKGKLLPDNIRLNKYGRFLRSTSLDELPELLNIIKGDMSIIGPRPLMARYLSYYKPEERERHTVRPGLTGYAQVHGRNALTWDERFKLDIQYVHNITFINDVKILLSTIVIVLNREGIELQELGNLDDYREKYSEAENKYE